MADINAKKILLKDRRGNAYLPITNAALVQYNNETVEHALDQHNTYLNGITNVTEAIVNKVNDLDSYVAIPETNDGFANIITRIGLEDGKVNWGKTGSSYTTTYTMLTAEKVAYTYPGGTTTSVAQTIANLDASIEAKIAKINAENVESVVTQDGLVVSSNSYNGATYWGDITLSVDHIDASKVTNVVDGKNLTDTYTAIKTVSDAQQTEITKLENSTYIAGVGYTEGSIRQISYDYTDTEVEKLQEQITANKIEEAENGAVTVSAGTDKTTLAVKVDGKTIKVNSDDNLYANLTINYSSDEKKIFLSYVGSDGTSSSYLSSFDANQFIIDGMLSDATFETVNAGVTGSYLKFVWNTDGGNKTTYVDVKELVDVYTAGDGLKLDDHQFSVVAGDGLSLTAKDGLKVKLESSDSYNGNNYLTVGENGLKLSYVNDSIYDKINTYINALDVEANAETSELKNTTSTVNNYVKTVSEIDGKINVTTGELTTDNISYVYTTTYTEDGAVRTYTHVDSLNDIIDHINNSLNSEFIGDINGSISQYIADRFNEVDSVQNAYEGMVMTGLVQTNAYIASIATSYVDDLTVHTKIGNTESGACLKDVLDDLNDRIGEVVATVNGTSYTANTYTGGEYTTSSYLEIKTTHPAVGTTEFTAYLTNVASASNLAALDSELSNGNGKTGVETETDGAVFSYVLSDKTISIDLSLF